MSSSIISSSDPIVPPQSHELMNCRDRCRTTNNMLGDAYCAAIVEALSKDDLARMDKEKELEEGMGEDDQLIDNMENGSKHSKESGKVHRPSI